MEQSDLFGATGAQRARLAELGWHFAGRLLSGAPCWRTPDGACVVEESEALAWLARHDAGGDDGDA